MGFKQFLSPIWSSKDARNNNINIQILLSFLAKGVGIGISLVQIPLLLKILGSEAYGIWLTLISVTSWISVLDIGIGNGLRNKLAESLALNDYFSAKQYISTAYICLGLIMLIPLLLSVIIIPYLDLRSIFNTSSTVSNNTLTATLLIITGSTIVNFVLGLVNQIMFGLQKNAITAIPSLLLGLFFIGFLYLLPHFIDLNLIIISWLYASISILSLLVFTIYVFTKWAEIKPDIQHFKKEYIKGIMSIGIHFFIIQIAGIIIFSTDNILITRLFGPEFVTTFNISFRLFNVLGILLSIVLAPFWSAYTEAYVKKEIQWIRKRIKIMNLAMIPISFVLVLLVFYHDMIIEIWIGTISHKGSELLPLYLAAYILVSTWNNIYAFFLNGISKTKEQLVTAIIAMVINIPLSIFFAVNCNLGVNGIVLASIVSLLIFAIVGPITTYKTLKIRE